MLTGNLVYLRLVEKEDLPKRVEWINDPEVQKTLNFDYPTSLAKTEKWFDTILLDPTRRDFSVFVLETNEYIGFCGFININVPVMKAEMYVTIGSRDHWGKGYGTDTYRVTMEYGFRELGLNRIYVYQLIDNYSAHRIVEKLGWKREGILRQDVYSHGRVADRYIVSVLREEWKGN